MRSIIECGIVEGFYGKPWSRPARKRFIDFMKTAGFRTYIYAPKDDPFHRERWREPYPEREARYLKSLVDICEKKGIEFCWALSPGLSIRYSSNSETEKLLDKFKWIADAGAGTYALFLDDIPPNLQHPEDTGKWKSLAAAHVDFTNRLRDRVKKEIGNARFWFCPTEYIGTRPTPYLTTIGEGMHPGIGVFWTGPLVVSPRITGDDARAIGFILKRKPLLWDNFPVNDYNPDKLNLGPVRAREDTLPELLSGYFANPMNQAAASCPPLLTVAEYLRDPAGYDPDEAWLSATAAPWGDRLPRPAVTVLREFCRLWQPGLFFGEPENIMVNLLTKARKGHTAELEELLDKVLSMRERIAGHEKLRMFLYEVSPFLKGLELDTKAAAMAIELQNGPGSPESILRLKKCLDKAWKAEPLPTAGNALRIYASRVLSEASVAQ